jgi:hypothetical protein
VLQLTGDAALFMDWVLARHFFVVAAVGSLSTTAFSHAIWNTERHFSMPGTDNNVRLQQRRKPTLKETA